MNELRELPRKFVLVPLQAPATVIGQIAFDMDEAPQAVRSIGNIGEHGPRAQALLGIQPLAHLRHRVEGFVPEIECDITAHLLASLDDECRVGHP